ncbi:glutamate--tRNA ligase 1 [Malaciobacter pacificus]|uniref:Glutamyl-tRNA synthetase n=1 Tax=Malaciobacter pacificus TaxID=1080223 RepID=A0A5C2H6E6_9BACT|nr:glutamate--tRNA ligase [Malaciobacter pacificus]QEP34527.1 glutamyl-tRNA synthetase [Malaciobacter pacificus]GGD33797.1 glutamate--tRNA ligase 1 [Malaciobacter pacificus]
MLRFAPSQTEDLSINKLRVAIYNYILSKQLNEDLVIRIDDYKKEKVIEGMDKKILELINLFSIEYKGVVYQSESLKYHQKLAMQLMGQKKAFSCFCSDEKLQELKEKAENKGKVFSYDDFCEKLSDETVLNTNAPFTVRMSKPKEDIKFTDALNGEISYKPYEVDAFHILTHDKTPTYNYSCAADDMIMNISTILRDEEHLLNTARQIHIRNSLGYDKEINYIHLPSLNTNLTVQELIDDGFLPSAIANYLVLLANNTPKEIFTLEEAIEWFKIENLSKESVDFDIEKLKEINRKHLETIEDMRLSKILGFADSDIGKLAKLYLNECSTIKEIKNKIDTIFSEKTPLNGFEDEYNKIKEAFKDAPFFNDYNDLEKYLSEKTKLQEDKLLKPLAYILTGNEDTLRLNEVYSLIKNYIGEIVK